MIDLTEMRKNPETFAQAVLKKDPSYNVENLIKLDTEYRQLSIHVENLRKQKNDLAKSVQGPISDTVRQQSIALGVQLKEQEALLQKVEKDFQDAYASCPNIMAEDVPAGNKPENKEVRHFGQKSFSAR